MTTLDKIKLIDFYLHGVDRGIKTDVRIIKGYKKEVFIYPDKFGHWTELNYHESLDALRPVIVKLNERYSLYVCFEDILYNTRNYLCGESDFTTVFESVVECITYLNEKEKEK
jgi:hypothetical protein